MSSNMAPKQEHNTLAEVSPPTSIHLFQQLTSILNLSEKMLQVRNITN